MSISKGKNVDPNLSFKERSAPLVAVLVCSSDDDFLAECRQQFAQDLG